MTNPEPLPGTRFGVIADAHIHPGKTPPFPGRLAEAFKGLDAIITLGDMGEASGLDQLENLARVCAVRGEDDQDDRISETMRLFVIGKICVAAVFDGVKSGFFASSDPLSAKPNLAQALNDGFGRRPDVLLCASTHKPIVACAEGTLIVNPGSPTLADKRTVATFSVVEGLVQVEHHTL